MPESGSFARSAHPAISRPHLLHSLEASSVPVLLCAPAGWGKTTLLGQWASSRPEPVAWIGFDDRTGETALIHGLVAELEAASAEAGVFESIGESGRSPIETARALALAVCGQGFSVVLDDVHNVTSEGALEALRAFVEVFAARGRLLMSARSRPAFIAARDVLHGRIVELTRDQLALAAEETARLLGDASESEVRRVHTITEGWPAGVRAVRLLLEQTGNAGRALESLREGGTDLGEYLGREVLAHLAPADRRTLEAVAVLDVVTRPACNALTGDRGAWKRLVRLQRQGLFVRADSAARAELRIHSLLRDELLRGLRSRSPSRAARLHIRHAAHLIRRGRPERAVDALLDAYDIAVTVDGRRAQSLLRRASDLLGETAGQMIVRGGRDWFMERVARIPSAEKATRPYLERVRAWLSRESGEAAPLPPIDDASPRAGEARCIDAAIRASRALRAGETPRLTLAALEARSAMPAEDAFLRSVVVSLLQAAYRFGGDPVVAAAAIEETAALASWTHRPAEAVQARTMLGVLYMMQGRLHAAEEALRHGLALALSTLGEDSIQEAMCRQFLGYVAWEWQQPERALAELETAARIARPLRHRGILSGALRMLSVVRLRLGDAAASGSAIAELESLVDTPDATARNREWMDGVRASLAVAAGSPDSLAAWISRWRYDARAAARAPMPELHARFQELHVFAHALTLLGRSREAIPLIRALGVAATAGSRRAFRVHSLALEAAALEAIGEIVAAESALRGALREGQGENMVRAIADAPAPMATVLARLETGDIDSGYITRVKAATGLAHADAASPTPREREVLDQLARGLSNKAIARALGLSPATVKTHLNHIFAKLNAKNRTHAVAQAREAGYLRDSGSGS